MKVKLSNHWFEDDQLLWLKGSFKTYNKTEIKQLCKKLGIKFTIKYNNKVTKVITDEKFDSSLNIPHFTPYRFYNLCRKHEGKSLESHEDQVIELLKGDKESIILALTIIGDNVIQPKWIPWLRLNKRVAGVRELLVKNKCGLGNTQYILSDFKDIIFKIKRNFNIPADYEEEFILELYKKVINE